MISLIKSTVVSSGTWSLLLTTSSSTLVSQESLFQTRTPSNKSNGSTSGSTITCSNSVIIWKVCFLPILISTSPIHCLFQPPMPTWSSWPRRIVISIVLRVSPFTTSRFFVISRKCALRTRAWCLMPSLIWLIRRYVSLCLLLKLLLTMIVGSFRCHAWI